MLFRGCTGHFQPSPARHTQTSSSMRLMLVARIHSSGPDGASDPTMAHLDNLSEVHLPKKNRLVLYVLWSKHLKKHVVWCCMVFDSSMGIQIQTSQGLFLSMTIPYFGGRSSQPPGRCFRWWVSSKQGVSQFSCFQLKDRIILAVKIMAFATFFLLTAGHGWILSDATVFQVLK